MPSRMRVGGAGPMGLVAKLVVTCFLLLFMGVAAVALVPMVRNTWTTEGVWPKLLGLGFASVFLLFPGLMLFMVWRRRAGSDSQSPTGTDGEEEAPSISQRAKGDGTKGCLLGAGLFLVVGLAFSAFFAVPAYRVVRARWWTPLDCTIVSSGVGSHSGDDGTTYSIDVVFRYEVDGVEYQSDRYRFLGGSSSGYDGKKAVVDRLQPGTVTTCWVDPEDPSSAVLNRGLSWEFLFALLPLVFVAGGAIGLWMIWTGRRKKRSPEETLETLRFREPESPAGEEWLPSFTAGAVDLEPQMGPWGKLGCIIGVGAFWNGIVGVFVYNLVKSWRQGGHDWVLALFLVPFVLIGLALLLGIPYQLLALANPRPHLRLSRGAIPLGGAASLSWRWSGAAGRLEELTIALEGKESATYRVGTSSRTATEVFAKLPVASFGEGLIATRGGAEIQVPLDSMHSFKATHNKIEWSLQLHGRIDRWPDVQETYPIVVTPPESRWS